jgi:hypothetical protein
MEKVIRDLEYSIQRYKYDNERLLKDIERFEIYLAQTQEQIDKSKVLYSENLDAITQLEQAISILQESGE